MKHRKPDPSDLARLLRLKQVETRTGKSRTAIYRGVAEGTFPKPVSLGGRSVAWVADEVDRWIDGRIAARGEPAKAASEAAA